MSNRGTVLDSSPHWTNDRSQYDDRGDHHVRSLPSTVHSDRQPRDRHGRQDNYFQPADAEKFPAETGPKNTPPSWTSSGSQGDTVRDPNIERSQQETTHHTTPAGDGHDTGDNTKVCISSDVEKQERDAPSRPRSLSNATTVPPGPTPPGASATLVSTDSCGNAYPEGGSTAYLCVFGSFCGLMASLGMMNTIGTWQAYLSSHQLQHLSSGTVGWIFGLYAFLSFFLSIQIGPIFDAYGPRLLIFLGSIFLTVSQTLLAQSTHYWHFMLSFGLLGGTGTSLVFTPAIAAIGHHFSRRRGQFVGLAAVGASSGGIVFPLTLQSLLPRIGFTWSCRVVALINAVLLLLANIFIRSRLPRKPHIVLADIVPDLSILRTNIPFAFTTLAVFFMEWALFIPLGYVSSYSLDYHVTTNTNSQESSTAFSYQLLAILNAGSCLGRYFPGLIADTTTGRFNAMIITIALCAIFTLGLWLPAAGSMPTFIAFLVLFGIASGSGISLTPVCVGQLCRTENLGRYYATCYTVASFATLTGIPIAGAIESSGSGSGKTGSGRGNWTGLITFTGTVYVASLLCLIAARVKGVGWSIRKVY